MRYGLAFAIAAAAIALRSAAAPLLGPHIPFLASFVAVVVCARLLGTGPAFFALGLGYLGVVLLVLPATQPEHIGVLSFRVAFALYTFAGLLCIGLFNLMARLRHQAQDTSKRLEREMADREAVGQRLLRSQRQFEKIAATTPDIIYVFDVVAGQNVYVNAAVSRVLGYSPEQIAELGASLVRTLVHPEDLAKMLNDRRTYDRLGDDDVYDHEVRMRHADGQYRWLRCREAVFERGSEGRARLVIGSAQDVTERRGREAELQRISTVLRTINEATPDMVFIKDLQGRLSYVNAAAARFLGRSEMELLGKTGSDFLPNAAQAESIQRADQQIVTTGKGQMVEEMLDLPTGRRWFLSAKQPYRDGEGQLVGIIGISRDITERKSADRLLIEQKDLLERVVLGESRDQCLRALTETVTRLHPAARACLVLLDPERGLLSDAYASHLSPAFLASLRGSSIASSQSGTCMAAISRARSVTCADVANSTEWSADWRNNCAAHGIAACHSTPVVASDGTVIGSFFLAFSEPHQPDNWELRLAEFGSHMSSIVLDRDRSAQALRESEARLAEELHDARLLQAISAEIVQKKDLAALYDKIVEAAAGIMSAERATLQVLRPMPDGETELELIAQVGLNAVTQKRWARVRTEAQSACVQALKSNGRIIVPDVERCDFISCATAREDYRNAEIRAVQSTPLRSRTGELVGLLSTHWSAPYEPTDRDLRRFDVLARQAADLIERLRAEEALREADRRKDEFLATLAHELRNPLAPLRNGLAVIRRAGSDPEALASAGEMMERQLGQMVRLIDDLLDVSRISRGKVELRSERLDLATAVASAVETSQPLIDSSGHRLTVVAPDEPVYVNADPVRLSQVIANLLNNAAKYTERGGWIRLSYGREGEEAVVRVQDNGVGISATMLPRVFEMFAQVDRSLNRAQGGLGIGLSLVRGLVEMHGGRVAVHSNGPGTGSEFVIRLPAIAVPAPVATVSPAPTTGDSEGVTKPTRRRILVVDDNEDSARSMSQLLKLIGHETRTANDGLEALDIAEAYRPDLILLDIGMPRLNGYETAARLRQRPWAANVILIALTGWGQQDDRRRSREAGFDHHLVKPVDMDVLEKLLSDAPTTTGSSELESEPQAAQRP